MFERPFGEAAAKGGRKEEIKRCDVKQGNLWDCDLIKQETRPCILEERGGHLKISDGGTERWMFFSVLFQVCSVVRYLSSGKTEGILIVHTTEVTELRGISSILGIFGISFDHTHEVK